MKILRGFLYAVMLVCIIGITVPVTVRAQDVKLIYAQVPDGWDAPHVWAWGPRGDAFPSWPGGAMQPDPNNPGWYFIHIPADKTGALISANEGTIQTSDFPVTGVNVWVTVADSDNFDVTEEQQTDGDFPEYVPAPVVPAIETLIDGIPIFVQVPDDWESPGMWAWGPRGNAFDEWPGEEMLPDPNNPGWYMGVLPADKTGALINANGGEVQTSDFPFTGVPLWITITDGEDFEVTEDRLTVGDLPDFTGFFFAEVPADTTPADMPDSDMITVRAYVPMAWVDPGLWAWNDDYGSPFAGWPGQGFHAMDGEWHIMETVGWIDHIIINALGGGVQTADIPIEMGRDIWIVIIDNDGNYYLSHEPIDPHNIEGVEIAQGLPERPPPVAIAAAATPAPPVEAPADDSETPVVLIVVIVVVVVAIVAAGAVIILKKKKK